MRQHPQARRTLLSVLIATLVLPPTAWAEQLSLAQYPAGSSSRQPAPNVIVTLDDSGSMGYYTGGGTTQNETRTTSRMYALKTALRTIFDPTTQVIPDGSIRMAWNTMNNCRAIPSAGGGCNSLNRMRVLDATHRANFLAWVGQPGAASSPNTRLSASGSTPTHHALIAAGDYLANGSPTAAESPWANVPGVSAGNPVLSCRKSYNVLMTDGGWNFAWTHGTDVARPKSPASPNTDGTTTALPDGTVYDVNSPYTRAYRDDWGQAIEGRNVSTLADLAFYYWSRDLAPGLTNNVLPRYRQSTEQTFGAVSLPPYWNPRNNPATWQHMSMYTIGFGDAARWRTTGTYAGFPVWDLASNDTYGGSLPDLIAGTLLLQKPWPNPFFGSPLGSRTITLRESANALDALTTNGEARRVELWHAAINSRGKFIASTDAASLVGAFREIFGEILSDTSAPVAGYANASTSIARNPTTQFSAGYMASVERNNETFTWLGYVRAATVAQNPDTGEVTVTPATGWATADTPAANATTATKLDRLDAAGIDNRLILTWSDASPGGGATSFQWTQDAAPALPALSTAQKNMFRAEGVGTVADTVAEQRLRFIRGDTSQDGASFNGTAFRKRGSRQGDTVNSALWYVADPVSNYAFDKYSLFAAAHAKRLPMVYVGANDGMLHGFSGVDGSEKIAYVPRGVIHNLADLTRSTYGHRYYVDGSPFSGDVNWGNASTPDWRTLLVGTLGAGGKGYFVLDVTNPGTTATDDSGQAANFSKANAASLVLMDKTAASTENIADAADARRDIGHITAAPVVEDGNPQKSTQIVRMNNGRWAVVMGNGYNSTNERPVLLVQYLDGDRSLLRIPAVSTGANASGNGLSAPRLVDIDGNGTPDVAYAGDLRGNLWKFNVSAASPAAWGVAFSGSPLYTAAHVNGNVSTRQPITAPPVVRANQRGARGLMVAFATGRNLTEADRTDVSVQSVYSVLDATQYRLESGRVVVDGSPTPVGSGYADLVQQTVDATEIPGEGSSSARTFWTVSQNDVPYTDEGAKKGWYLDLPQEGERVLAQMTFYDASNIIELISEVPASGGNTAEESCQPPSTDLRKYRTLLNIMDGKAPSVQVMDTNGDGYYTAADGGTSRMTAAPAENGVTTHKEQVRMGSDSATDKLRRLPEIPLRPNWRQLQ